MKFQIPTAWYGRYWNLGFQIWNLPDQYPFWNIYPNSTTFAAAMIERRERIRSLLYLSPGQVASPAARDRNDDGELE